MRAQEDMVMRTKARRTTQVCITTRIVDFVRRGSNAGRQAKVEKSTREFAVDCSSNTATSDDTTQNPPWIEVVFLSVEEILNLLSLLLVWSESPGYLNTEPIANHMPDPSEVVSRRILRFIQTKQAAQRSLVNGRKVCIP